MSSAVKYLGKAKLNLDNLKLRHERLTKWCFLLCFRWFVFNIFVCQR